MRFVDAAASILLAALWGSSYLFIRVASPALGPVFLVETRLLIAAIVLVLYAWARRRMPMTLKRKKEFLLLGALNAAIPFTLVAVAELRLPASMTAILSATNPLFTAPIAAMWLHDRLDLRQCGGLVLGLLGVVSVVGGSQIPATRAALLSVGAAVLAAFCFACGGIYTKAVFPATPTLTLATMQQVTATLVLLPFTLGLAAAGSHTVALSTSVILAVTALAILSTSVAYLIYFFLLDRVGPSRTHTTSFLVPVFGALWGFLFLHEDITWGMAGGAAVIALGLALVFYPSGRRPAIEPGMSMPEELSLSTSVQSEF